MIPIHELLNRIRWDREFARGEFEIGYYDRVQERIIRTPFRDIYFERGDHFAFHLLDDEGEEHAIPLHRVREVYRDGVLIWHRDTIPAQR